MRVGIIGGTGFIGSETVGRLAAAEHEVLVIHRGRQGGDLPDGFGASTPIAWTATACARS